MKEYKYRINGNPYTVKVGDIDNNLAKVEVNGVPYKVELEKTEKPVTIVSKPRPSAAPRTDTGAKVITKAPVSASGFQVKAPPRCGDERSGEGWRQCKSIRHRSYA